MSPTPDSRLRNPTSKETPQAKDPGFRGLEPSSFIVDELDAFEIEQEATMDVDSAQLEAMFSKGRPLAPSYNSGTPPQSSGPAEDPPTNPPSDPTKSDPTSGVGDPETGLVVNYFCTGCNLAGFVKLGIVAGERVTGLMYRSQTAASRAHAKVATTCRSGNVRWSVSVAV